MFFTASSANDSAKKSGTPRIGQMMIIPKILNNRWVKAVATAITLAVTSAASNAVMVVPMFAPNVKGKICRKVSMPAPANGTARDVVIELLCTMTVKMRPTIKARAALLNKVWLKNDPTFPMIRAFKFMTI